MSALLRAMLRRRSTTHAIAAKRHFGKANELWFAKDIDSTKCKTEVGVGLLKESQGLAPTAGECTINNSWHVINDSYSNGDLCTDCETTRARKEAVALFDHLTELAEYLMNTAGSTEEMEDQRGENAVSNN